MPRYDFLTAPSWQVVLIAGVAVAVSSYFIARGTRGLPGRHPWLVPVFMAAFPVLAGLLRGNGVRYGLWIAIVASLAMSSIFWGRRTSLSAYKVAVAEFGERSREVRRIANWMTLRITLAVVVLLALSGIVLK